MTTPGIVAQVAGPILSLSFIEAERGEQVDEGGQRGLHGGHGWRAEAEKGEDMDVRCSLRYIRCDSNSLQANCNELGIHYSVFYSLK